MNTNRLRWALLAALGFSCAAECGAQEDPELELELLGCVDASQPWTTCAEFCEWDGAVCAEQACGGRTTRAYESPYYCSYDIDPIEREFGCEEPLAFDEAAGVYYFDCCCDYR